MATIVVPAYAKRRFCRVYPRWAPVLSSFKIPPALIRRHPYTVDSGAGPIEFFIGLGQQHRPRRYVGAFAGSAILIIIA